MLKSFAHYLIGFLFFYNLLSFESSGYTLYQVFSLLIFRPGIWLSFYPLKSIFQKAEVFILIKSNLSTCYITDHSFGVQSKKSLPQPMLQRFSCTNFITLGSIYRSRIHF